MEIIVKDQGVGEVKREEWELRLIISSQPSLYLFPTLILETIFHPLMVDLGRDQGGHEEGERRA
jgi:hypothetical protein